MKIFLLLLLELIAGNSASAAETVFNCDDWEFSKSLHNIYPTSTSSPLDDFFNKGELFKNVEAIPQKFPPNMPDSCRVRLLDIWLSRVNYRLVIEVNNGNLEEMEPAHAAIVEAANQTQAFIDKVHQCEESRAPLQCLRNDPSIMAALEATNTALTKVATRLTGRIRKIQDKFSQGAIAACIVEKDLSPCFDSPQNQSCHDALNDLWWMTPPQYENTGYEPDENDRYFLSSGGFHHLLWGTAFTCSEGLQNGETCALYAGSSLLSHYCETPNQNPWVDSNTCANGQGPNFCCPDNKKFLDKAYELGLWQAHKVDHKGTPLGPAIEEGPRVVGQPGMSGFQSRIFYQEAGFDVVTYSDTEEDWAKILEALDQGHPVGASFRTRAQGRHIVVLEGRVNNRWVILRDSNFNEEKEGLILQPMASFRNTFFFGSGVRPPSPEKPLPELCR